MMKRLIVAAALVALSVPAFAAGGEGNNTNCNGQGNPNSPCTGNGGAGGAGGNAAAVAAAAASAKASAAAIAAQQQQQRQQQQLNNTTRADGGAGGSAAAGSQSNSGGNTINMGDSSYSVPAIASTATAPSYALGNCGWAFSGGFQAFVAGASGGTAGVYDICLKMQAAEHFRKTGQHAQAKAIECLNSDLRKAHYEAGEPCRADMPRDQQMANRAPVATVTAPPPAVVLPANCETKTVSGKTFVTCN